MNTANTIKTADQAYELVMNSSLPAEELMALGKRIQASAKALVKPLVHRKTKKERFMECVGAWANDPRTTSEIITDIRAKKNINPKIRNYHSIHD